MDPDEIVLLLLLLAVVIVICRVLVDAGEDPTWGGEGGERELKYIFAYQSFLSLSFLSTLSLSLSFSVSLYLQLFIYTTSTWLDSHTVSLSLSTFTSLCLCLSCPCFSACLTLETSVWTLLLLLFLLLSSLHVLTLRFHHVKLLMAIRVSFSSATTMKFGSPQYNKESYWSCSKRKKMAGISQWMEDTSIEQWILMNKWFGRILGFSVNNEMLNSVRKNN